MSLSFGLFGSHALGARLLPLLLGVVLLAGFIASPAHSQETFTFTSGSYSQTGIGDQIGSAYDQLYLTGTSGSVTLTTGVPTNATINNIQWIVGNNTSSSSTYYSSYYSANRSLQLVGSTGASLSQTVSQSLIGQINVVVGHSFFGGNIYNDFVYLYSGNTTTYDFGLLGKVDVTPLYNYSTAGNNGSNYSTLTAQFLLHDIPPVVVGHSYTVIENTPLSVNAANGVLASATDAQNRTLTAKLAAGPAHGAVTLNTDGSFGYVPNNGFYGTDSFTYQAVDSNGIAGNIAAATIQVNLHLTTQYVSPSGSDSNPGTLALPKMTIQAAINAALSGDTIIVEDGTYTGPGDVDLDFGGRNLTVTSQNGAATTIINCAGTSSTNHRGFYFHSGETNAVVTGLTIENGYEKESNGNGFGGAISVASGSTLALTNCMLSGNSADEGGGIYNNGTTTLTNTTVSSNTASYCGGTLNSGTITLTQCTLSGNSGINGGGILNAGTATLNSCLITENYSAGSGGGINNNGATMTLTGCDINNNSAFSGGGIFSAGLLTATNCLLTENTVYSSYYSGPGQLNSGGGGIYNYFGQTSLTNCTLTANSAQNGSGVYSGLNSAVTLTNDILYGDVPSSSGEIYAETYLTYSTALSVLYSDIQGGYAGTNNINANPLFVSSSAPIEPHLQDGSPCAGAGTSVGAPTTDIAGYHRPNPPSIGAFEGKQSAVTTLTSSLNPSAVGQSVTFTAAVTVSYGTPTGSVTFTLDGAAQPPVVLTSGAATFTPATLALGSHTITAAYSGSVFYSAGSPATLTQVVASPPVAVNDSYTTSENQALTVTAASGVLANDTDPQHTALRVTLPNGPNTAHGTLSFSLTTGSFTYTPNTGYVGPDSFTYYDTDASGLISNTATVSITVTQAPVSILAVSAPASATAGAPFTVTVTAQDAYGGTVTNCSDAVSLQSSDYTANLPVNAVLTNGVGTFTVRMHTAGSQTITAYDTTHYGIQGTSGNINVVLATPTIRSVPTTYSTLQAAIDASVDGDTVLVGDGTYSGPGNRDLDFHGNSLTVTSQNGAAKTIIDCGGSSSADHRGFYFHTGEPNAVVNGFTIKNGYESGVNGSNGYGGGVDLESSANNNIPTLTVSNCVLTAGYAASGGGGIADNAGSLTLTGSTLSGNSSASGGGLFLNSFATVMDTTFSNNTASYGGAVSNANINSFGSSYNYGSASLTGCTFSGNTAGSDGGALCNTGGQFNLTNCLLSGNSAQSSGGAASNETLSYNSFGSFSSAQTTFTNCILTGNTANNNGGAISNGNSPFSGGGGFSSSASVQLTNCLLSSNTASNGVGGGLYTNASASLYNCTVTGNSATLNNYSLASGGGGLYSDVQGHVFLADDILYGDTSPEIVDYTSLQYGSSQNNVNAIYCDIGELSGFGNFADGGSNLNADPLFVNVPGNLHLQSSSPCIGAGIGNYGSSTDLDGVTRTNPPSIGAYEGTPKAATTIGIVSSRNPSVFGQSVTFTATVTGSGGTPAGTVTFTDTTTGTTLGTGTLSGGIATISTATLALGSHTITAAYSGNTLFSAGNVALTQTVTQASTTVNLTSTANPSVFGQSVTFTATVVGSGGTPTGSVTFTDTTAGTTLATVNLGNGTAIYTTISLAVGSHSLTATYSGSTQYGPGTGTLTQSVKKDATTTALVAVSGASLSFTATVAPIAPGAGTPTGSVTFTLDKTDTTPGTVTTVSLLVGQTKATYTPPTLTLGNHTLTAVYSGDSSFAASTSPTVTQAGGMATTTTVTTSNNPAAFQQTITLTASVAAGSGGVPTGTVYFTAALGSTIRNLGSGTPVNGQGQASLTLPWIDATNGAQWIVKAAYAPADSNSFSPSNGTLTQTSSGLNDLSSDSHVSVTLGSLSHTGSTFTQTATITSTYLLSDGSASQPYALVLVGLPSNITLTNATGKLSSNGNPYIVLPGGMLPKGVTTMKLTFSNPSSAAIKYAPRLIFGYNNPNLGSYVP